MPRTKNKTTDLINAKPEEVFAYVSDLTTHGDWSTNPLEITASDASEIGVGKEYTMKAEFRGGEVTGTLKVTEYKPSTKFAFEVSDTTSEHTHSFTFAPEGEGTRIERVNAGKWPFGSWLLVRSFGWMMVGKPKMMESYDNLKKKLEK